MSIGEFDQWLTDNREQLSQMFLDSNYEILYHAWIAGYNKGNASAHKRIDASWRDNPDRMGGQFTAEEIDRSRRGGEGW